MCVCICIYIYIYRYIHMYVYIYIYMYTLYEYNIPTRSPRNSSRRYPTSKWGYRGAPDTPNLPTNIVDFRGFDSSVILI